MGIGARDKGDADVELPGEVLLLRCVESSQQSPAAIVATDAYRAVNIALIRSKWFTVKRHQMVKYRASSRRQEIRDRIRYGTRTETPVVRHWKSRASCRGLPLF